LTRRSERDTHETIDTPAAHCPAGHSLKPGSALIGGDEEPVRAGRAGDRSPEPAWPASRPPFSSSRTA